MGTPTASGIYAGLMDLSARRKKLTLEERAHCLAEGRCLYYGGIGHMAQDSLNAYRHPLHAAKAALVPHNHDPTAAAIGNAAYLN